MLWVRSGETTWGPMNIIMVGSDEYNYAHNYAAVPNIIVGNTITYYAI